MGHLDRLEFFQDGSTEKNLLAILGLTHPVAKQRQDRAQEELKVCEQGHKNSNHLLELCLADWLGEEWQRAGVVCPLAQASQEKAQPVKLAV